MELRVWKRKPPNTWLLDLDQYAIRPTPSKVIEAWDIKGSDWTGPYYADSGEDGIISYLFDWVNDVFKFAVDIGAAHGYGGSNIRHIADRCEWKTTEFDGSNKWSNIHPRVKNLRITPKNICSELLKCETPYQIDLLSLDIDSMDWYVLKSFLEGGFQPNVIILEYNPIFNFDDEIVRTYSQSYNKDKTSGYGASLRAFEKLLNKYNHSLVGNGTDIDNQMYSNNAIFLNNKFIREFDKIQTIKELHPKTWKESWKKNTKKVIVFTEMEMVLKSLQISDLTEVKKYLIEKNIVKGLESEDYEVINNNTN